MKPIYLITLLSCLPLPTLADSCVDFAVELAAEYKSEIDSLNEKFHLDLAELEERYLTIRQDPNVSFAMIATIWQDYYDYPKHYQRFTHDIYDMVNGIATDENAERYCGAEEKLEIQLEQRVERYQQLLEHLKEGISSRIELEQLDSSEGLAIISAYSYGVAPKITIVGDGLLNSFKIGPLAFAEHFEIRKLQQGTYRWDRVELGFNGFALQDSNINISGSTSYSFFDFTENEFEFSVMPQKLNFTGVFIFETKGKGARGDLYDRSAILVQMLETRYPYLMERYEWHNSLAPQDPFLQFYAQERLNKEVTE
ncbi:hypothetical protein [Alteromonas flava]|uniref:hypothetical protein n=1 Tax=Alteromonas flava TaxID=2048003 RepID=UPI000F5D9D82|nr:hypothetical protein [Alteromonas flava]